MIGSRYLFISGEEKIIKISQPKNHKYKSVPQFANQDVLKVILYYENKDRKPSRLVLVEFDRMHLDSNGLYVLTDADRKRRLHNFFEFGILSIIGESEDEKTVSIPVAPIIPNDKEKKVLYDYLANKLPVLAKDAPYIVEERIRSLNEKYEEYKNIAKNSKKYK